MQRNPFGVLLPVLFLVINSGPVFAEADHPVQEISGIVKQVEADLLDGRTTIEFCDGRKLEFRGLYELVFDPDENHCLVKCQYKESVLGGRMCIVSFECKAE
jgi:hypothetical protein